MLVATGLPTTPMTTGSSNSTTTSSDDSPTETVHVPLNGTVEFDCSLRTAVVLAAHNVSEETAANVTASVTVSTTVSPNSYVLVMFKKDGLVVQVSNPKMRVEALGAQNEGTYECGHHQLDKFGKLNYVFQKAWNLVIDCKYPPSDLDSLRHGHIYSHWSVCPIDPVVEVKTTTPEPVARGEVFATPESLTELLDLDKKNINIFTCKLTTPLGVLDQTDLSAFNDIFHQS